MSQEAAAKFRDLIGQDRVLQQKVVSTLQGEGDFDALVALGAERGCEFTADEASALIEATFGDDAEGELSDFELELVAGGASKGFASFPKPKPKASSTPVSTAGTLNISSGGSTSNVSTKVAGTGVLASGSSCGGSIAIAGTLNISTSSTC